MKCDARILSVATVITVAVAWTVCAAFVALLPATMVTLTGHMVHADLEGMTWSMTPPGFFVGLFAWSLLAGVTVWLAVRINNSLAE